MDHTFNVDDSTIIWSTCKGIYYVQVWCTVDMCYMHVQFWHVGYGGIIM